MNLLKLAGRIALAGLFVTAGVAHFTDPEPFTRIVPPVLPFPRELVYISGACEILGGVGLLTPAQRGAALGLSALLVAVFPANIYMAVSGVKFHGFPSEPWMAWARLPLQPALIGALLWAAPKEDG